MPVIPPEPPPPQTAPPIDYTPTPQPLTAADFGMEQPQPGDRAAQAELMRRTVEAMQKKGE